MRDNVDFRLRFKYFSVLNSRLKLNFENVQKIRQVKMASFLENSSQALTEIRNELVCQICKGHARPGKKQWYRCLAPHMICQDCKLKNKKCSCGSRISKEYCRMTEKLLSIDGMKYNCANTKNGCQEVRDENALEDHEPECIYRLVPCLYNSLSHECDCEKVTFHEVIQHYEEEMENVTLFDLKVKISCGDSEVIFAGEYYYCHPRKFNLNNQTFLLLRSGKIEDEVENWWVSILGSPNEAKHFSYTLKFFGPKNTIIFKGPVAAIDESFDTLYAAGKCFATPETAFMAQVLDENGKFEYSLEIRNLKEEVKDENYESGISDNDEDSKE